MPGITTAHAKGLIARAPAAVPFSLPSRSRTPTKRLATRRGRNPDALRQIGFSDESMHFERRMGYRPRRERRSTHARWIEARVSSSDVASLTATANQDLPQRHACARMQICPLNGSPAAWRISRLLFAGTVVNARGFYQMPIRHRGHAGLRLARPYALGSLRSAPQPRPFSPGIG